MNVKPHTKSSSEPLPRTLFKTFLAITATAFLAAPTVGGALTLYVSLGDGVSIDKVDSTGAVSLFATLPAGSYPRCLAFDASGNLYAAEETNEKIDKISPGGAVSTFATLAENTTPDGLAFDASGNLYVTGFPNKVYKISSDGLTVTTFANLVSGSGPFGVVYDGSSSNFYVADGASGQISKISPDGFTVTPFAIGGISAPRYIAIGPAGVPKLTIVHNGPSSVKVLWPDTGSYTLQQNASLDTTNWVTSGYAITNGFGTNICTITPLTGNLFLRLSAP
jgi:DNA-binding beta-propeller fold protein YncE